MLKPFYVSHVMLEGVFANFIFVNFSNMIITSIFSAALKLTNITFVFKKTFKISK